jgi:hypothetical protein
VVDDARTKLRWPIRTRVEKRVGIPQARNAALAPRCPPTGLRSSTTTRSPEPGWLDALLRTQRATGADVVTGPSLAALRRAAAGGRSRAGCSSRCVYATGTRSRTAYTNNVLARASALRGARVAFDERFTRSAEDAELFARRLALGRQDRLGRRRDRVTRACRPRAPRCAGCSRAATATARATARQRSRTAAASRGAARRHRARLSRRGGGECSIGAARCVRGLRARGLRARLRRQSVRLCGEGLHGR